MAGERLGGALVDWSEMLSGDFYGTDMAILEVDLTADLMEGLKNLAVRHYGSDKDGAMGGHSLQLEEVPSWHLG